MTPKPPTDICHALDRAEPRPPDSASSTQKKNYAERLSRALAQVLAASLRSLAQFKAVLPSEDGSGQESRVRSSRGIKKLDVNVSSPEMGLGLGVSIKTINYRDPSKISGKLKRYTKNYSRNDNELRAEAVDYHRRQPYAVLVALIFLPVDSCDDAVEKHASSFGSAVKYFRSRANRRNPKNEEDRFEQVFIGLYDHKKPRRGSCLFFDVMDAPPKSGRPAMPPGLDLGNVVARIAETYNQRNSPPFEWAEPK